MLCLIKLVIIGLLINQLAQCSRQYNVGYNHGYRDIRVLDNRFGYRRQPDYGIDK